LTIPNEIQELLEHDGELAKLWTSEQKLKDAEEAKKLLTHLKSKEYLVSRRDLTAIFGKNGEYLDQLLSHTGYQPVEFSTGEELDQAIESTSFIAEAWLPRGHVTVLVSSPGLGKSYLALAVVKIITTGQEKWFDGVTSVKVHSKAVIWCEAEGFQAGLKDRIKQLGIPPESIILPFNDPLVDFKLEQHLENLKRAIAYHKPDLVVIDSLRGSHGREENDSKAMQSVMSRLVSLAKEFDVAVLVTHHTNKPAPGQPDLVDLHRVRGSTAITANCRMIWGLEQPDPKDETVRLKVVKSNLAPFPKPRGLIITEEGIEWTKAPATLEERNLERVRETKEDTAAGWLRDFLKAGPKPSKEVQSEGEEAGHSGATLRRASDRPGFITKLAPDKEHNFWRWALDAHSPPSNRDEQVEHV